MHALLALAVAIAWGSFAGTATASCIREDLLVAAARADAVVHARIVALEGPSGVPSRFAFAEVLTVLKGSAPARIGVALGPEVGGGRGPVGVTSVDHSAKPGEDHTLCPRQNAPGGYATDACAGSHPGAPTAEEAAYFGAGRPQDRAPGAITEATGTDRAVAAVATLAAAAAAAIAIAYARRSSRGAASA